MEQIKLKSEVKDPFVKALTSGEYPQGRLQLRTNDGRYCCIGVLTDLAAKAGVVVWDDNLECGSARFRFGIIGENGYKETCVMPKAVAEWAFEKAPDARGDVPFIDENGVQVDTMMAMNDTQDAGFVEIAAKVEKYL